MKYLCRDTLGKAIRPSVTIPTYSDMSFWASLTSTVLLMQFRTQRRLTDNAKIGAYLAMLKKIAMNFSYIVGRESD